MHRHACTPACAHARTDTHAHLHAWLRWAQAPPRQLAVRVAAAKKQQQQPKRRKAAKRGGPSPPRRDAGGPLPGEHARRARAAVVRLRVWCACVDV
eukprot:366303-Chlamydomonas_euryale.AAC.10